MSTSHQPGSYVTHAKLLELGSGQVISSDKGTIRIRFASGERNFLIEAVRGFLAVSEQGPERSSRAARSKTKRKA